VTIIKLYYTNLTNLDRLILLYILYRDLTRYSSRGIFDIYIEIRRKLLNGSISLRNLAGSLINAERNRISDSGRGGAVGGGSSERVNLTNAS